MPARPTRRRAEPNAGPAITPDLPDAVIRGAVTREPVRTEQPGQRAVRKWTAVLDEPTHQRFETLLQRTRRRCGRVATRVDGPSGKLRGGYDLSRVDVLRALVVLAEDDEQLQARVAQEITRQYGATS